MSKIKQRLKNVRILGLSLPIFIILAAIALLACYLGVLPTGMVGALLFLMLFGELLNLIGNVTPIIRTFLGGGAIVCILTGSTIAYWNLIPTDVINTTTEFMKDGGFLDFYIAALITGSILGMDRKLLIKAAIRFLPCIMGAVIVALLLVGLIGMTLGMTPSESVAYIGIPIMGGGMGAGAVPIAKVFETTLGIPSDEIISRLVPAVALGNAFAIICGGLLNRLGKKLPALSGNGNLLRSHTDNDRPYDNIQPHKSSNVSDYAIGIVTSLAFLTLGNLIALGVGKIGLDIHPYAWMIICVAIFKATGIVPERYEIAANIWYNFVAKNWTAALMLGIGIAYTDMGHIISALTPQYIVLVLIVVIGAIIGGGAVGYLVGFYPIEAAITAGLCMANMGGTGDVAVLMASHRMKLMPFAQISSRLGGAFIILIATIISQFFLA